MAATTLTTTKVVPTVVPKEFRHMRTRITNHARRAFTVIEILIVVVILGILAAIVISHGVSAKHQT